jgi:hypothetical protein
MFENYPLLEFCKVPNYHATSPPSPTEFPPNFGTFGFHSRKPLVYVTKQFTGENHSTFPANPSRIKADPQKEDKNVHLTKIKKITRSINKQKPIQTNKETRISLHNVFQAKTGLQQTNTLALFSLKQINPL